MSTKKMCVCLRSVLQDPRESGHQQHSDSGGSEEERLLAELGEAAFQEQHYTATELPAAAHPRYECIVRARGLSVCPVRGVGLIVSE